MYIQLTDDGAAHRVRVVLGNAGSPRALASIRR